MMRKLTVSRTAHVYSQGDPESARTSWMVCHGYGQLASKFIRSFEGLDNDHFIIAPEGLSKFYWNGFDGPVVASWMTREHREDEITDHSNFLNQIYSWLPTGTQKVLLGFSQGVATAIRYLDRNHDAFDHVILVGGWLPEDVDYRNLSINHPESRFWILFGDKDPYYPKERIQLQDERLRSAGLSYEMIIYPGEHKVTSQSLIELMSKW